MSRTFHHRYQKRAHAGEDLWSRRAGLGGHVIYNSYGKRLTRKLERAQAKEKLINKLKEV